MNPEYVFNALTVPELGNWVWYYEIYEHREGKFYFVDKSMKYFHNCEDCKIAAEKDIALLIKGGNLYGDL
jgi:hypothetical protein